MQFRFLFLCVLFLQQIASQVYVTETYYLSTNCTGSPLFFIAQPFKGIASCVPVACTTTGFIVGSAGAHSVNCVNNGLPSLPSGMIGYQNWVSDANCSGNPSLIYGAPPQQCTNVSSQLYNDALIVQCAGTSVVLNDFYNTQRCTGIPITNTLGTSCSLVGGGSYVGLGCSGQPAGPTAQVYQTSTYYDSASCSGSPVIFTATPVISCVTTGCLSNDVIGTTGGIMIACVSGVPSLPSNMIGVKKWYGASCTGNPNEIIGATSTCSNHSLAGAPLSVFLQCTGYHSISTGEFFSANCSSNGATKNVTESCTTTIDGSFIQLGCDATKAGFGVSFLVLTNLFVLLVIL